MFSTCFFPKASSILEKVDELSKDDEKKNDMLTHCDEETEITSDDDDVAQDSREEVSFRDDAEKNSSSTGTSIIGDFAVLRDFFLAAFSDGYYKVG